jgi:hypothetical protein
VTLVYKTEITTRSFPNWTMGFSLIDQASVDSTPGMNDFLANPQHDMSYFTEQPSRAAHLLEIFREQSSH